MIILFAGCGFLKFTKNMAALKQTIFILLLLGLQWDIPKEFREKLSKSRKRVFMFSFLLHVQVQTVLYNFYGQFLILFNKITIMAVVSTIK